MKKAVLALLISALLLGAAGCGNDDASFAAGGQPAGSASSAPVEVSSAVSETESAAESLPTSHQVESEPEPTPWPEAVAGDGGDFDLLASSPYCSGQEALLQGICCFSTRKPPERFLWLNEEKVREAWGIEGYVSACCQDFVAFFDFDRSDEEGQREWFRVYIALFPGVETPEFDHDGSRTFTPVEDWAPVEDRPGFETRKLSVTFLPSSRMPWWEEPASAEASPTPEPTPIACPPACQIRWESDGFQVMAHVPESGLDAFWENVDELLIQVDRDSVENPRGTESKGAEPVASVSAE